MTDYSFGDIVLVPFPFTDQTDIKKRPAVVISSEMYNSSLPDIVLMAITSRIKTPLTSGEVKIGAWKDAGLLKSSVVKPVFTTIEKKIVLKKLGKLNQIDENALRSNLQSLLG